MVVGEIDVRVGIEKIAVADGRMMTRMVVETNSLLPAQDEHLLDNFEQTTQVVGSEFMRAYYCALVEKADAELVLSYRNGKDGKGITRHGHKKYTIKTVFGTVIVPRIRIKYADGSTQIPSAHKWRTPKQVMISKGLKNAACNLAMKQSYANSVRQMERQTGEAKIISKSTIVNIMRAAGKKLAAANESRAEQVFEQEPGGKALLGEWNIHIAESYFEVGWLDGEDREDLEMSSAAEIDELYEQLQWETNQLMAASQLETESNLVIAAPPLNNAETTTAEIADTAATSQPATNLIVVQVDENLVHSQISEERKYVVNYSGVVTTAEKSYYFSANTSAQLIWQVSGLLSVLAVHRADNNIELLLLSDGAWWIRNWYNGWEITNKQAILCWFHLNKRCWRLIREAISDKEARILVKKTLQTYLWQGQVEQAKGYFKTIADNSDDGIGAIKINDKKAWATLIRYIAVHQPEIPNYRARWQHNQGIASTRVEKFNDNSVSTRCKKRGLRWTRAGVAAIAGLETATRNGERERWQQAGTLASWPALTGQRSAA